MTADNVLYLGDLSILASEEELQDELDARGFKPEEVKIMRANDGRPRGFGFVSFATRSEAVAVMKEMDGQTLHGRKLRIKFAAHRVPDLTPITCSAPIHSVHVKFTTHLLSNFDGTYLPSFFISSLILFFSRA